MNWTRNRDLSSEKRTRKLDVMSALCEVKIINHYPRCLCSRELEKISRALPLLSAQLLSTGGHSGSLRVTSGHDVPTESQITSALSLKMGALMDQTISLVPNNVPKLWNQEGNIERYRILLRFNEE